jgi:hypothetical protein
MEQLAARVEGFLAEHSGSQRVVRDQKARRKAVLDKQHAARAADAMNRRGIVGSLLSAAVSAPASDSSGDAFEERSKSVLDSPTVAVECDDFMRDAGPEIPTASDLDDVDVATAHGSSKASSRSIRLKLMAEFATPEVRNAVVHLMPPTPEIQPCLAACFPVDVGSAARSEWCW